MKVFLIQKHREIVLIKVIKKDAVALIQYKIVLIKVINKDAIALILDKI